MAGFITSLWDPDDDIHFLNSGIMVDVVYLLWIIDHTQFGYPARAKCMNDNFLGLENRVRL
jgi:hypothetical protein